MTELIKNTKDNTETIQFGDMELITYKWCDGGSELRKGGEYMDERDLFDEVVRLTKLLESLGLTNEEIAIWECLTT